MRHPIPAGYLGHRRTGHDLHDGVIALFHDAQLHEHGPVANDVTAGMPGRAVSSISEANVNYQSESDTSSCRPGSAVSPTTTRPCKSRWGISSTSSPSSYAHSSRSSLARLSNMQAT